jgi:hypothetical protein
VIEIVEVDVLLIVGEVYRVGRGAEVAMMVVHRIADEAEWRAQEPDIEPIADAKFYAVSYD